jgi:hypothetical protein
VSLNLEKSGYVKAEGSWLRSLKFLGSNFDPFAGKLNAASRSGNVSEFALGGESPGTITLSYSSPWNPELVTSNHFIRTLGGPKFSDPIWMDYFFAHEDQVVKYQKGRTLIPLTYREALKEPKGLSTLMGTVWCKASSPGSKELSFVKGSFVDRFLNCKSANLKNCSSLALANILELGNPELKEIQ